jgi:hypothetical protein
MTTEPGGEKKESTWWPSAWFRDQLFWRDVTTRALAGLIVVIITAITALASGLLENKSIKYGVATIAVLLIWALIWVPLSSKSITWSKGKSLVLRVAVLVASGLFFVGVNMLVIGFAPSVMPKLLG